MTVLGRSSRVLSQEAAEEKDQERQGNQPWTGRARPNLLSAPRQKAHRQRRSEALGRAEGKAESRSREPHGGGRNPQASSSPPRISTSRGLGTGSPGAALLQTRKRGSQPQRGAGRAGEAWGGHPGEEGPGLARRLKGSGSSGLPASPEQGQERRAGGPRGWGETQRLPGFPFNGQIPSCPKAYFYKITLTTQTWTLTCPFCGSRRCRPGRGSHTHSSPW